LAVLIPVRLGLQARQIDQIAMTSSEPLASWWGALKVHVI